VSPTATTAAAQQQCSRPNDIWKSVKKSVRFGLGVLCCRNERLPAWDDFQVWRIGGSFFHANYYQSSLVEASIFIRSVVFCIKATPWARTADRDSA
jgi:hypothetical protein